MTVYEYSFGLIRLEISFGSPLQEIFYQEISETSDDYPFIRTECVIDTVQATTYLMEAIVNLYRAIDQRGKRCADSDVGCAVNVAGFITCITWVSAYLSLAASSCAQAVNPGALCSADWLTITGAFGEIATAGAAVGTDCDIPAKWAQRFFGIGITTTRRPGICLKRSVCPTDLKCRSLEMCRFVLSRPYLKYFPGVRLLKNSTSPIHGAGPPPRKNDFAPPRRTAKLPPPILEKVYKFTALDRVTLLNGCDAKDRTCNLSTHISNRIHLFFSATILGIFTDLYSVISDNPMDLTNIGNNESWHDM